MSTVKRRRHIRYDIKLAATLLVNNVSFKCMIHDFCSGGLFLIPLQLEGIEDLKPNKKIQVLFSVNAPQGGKEFNLDAKIMHTRDNGIGIAFEGNSEAAFEALKKEAKSTSKLSTADRPSSSADQSKQKKLEDELASLAGEVLPVIIDNFYQHSETRLLEASEQAKYIENSAALQEAFSNINMSKDSLVKNFCAITQDFFHLLQSNTESAKEEISDSDSLSLIEKNDFEDWLNLSVIIRNLESHFEMQLDQLQKKIAYLLKVNKDDVINPVTPSKLCDHFHENLSTIEHNTIVKRILYSVFESVLLDLLPDLYKKMDAYMIGKGTPERVVGMVNWGKINPEVGHTKKGSSQEDGETLFTAQPVVSAQEAAIVAQQTALIPQQPPLAGQETAPPPEESLATQQTTPTTPVTSLAGQETIPVVNVANKLLQLLQGQNFPKGNIESSAVTAQEYSSDEISTALAKLQQSVVNNNDQSYSNNILLDALKNTSTPNKQLSKVDRDNLEVYENLFEILLNDMLLGKDAQSYLKDLHLPILDQAMRDPGFLASEDHPARKIVNNLAWLESAVKDNKSAKSTYIRETLDQLIEQVNQESLNNPEIINSVEEQLGDLTTSVNNSIDHNIKRVTDVYEGKQKLEKTRLYVQEEITRRFPEKKIPKIIISLLEAGWQHLLVITKLNEEEQDFQNYLRIISNLNEWLKNPEKAHQEQAKLNTTLEFIDQQLQTVCTNTFLHNSILDKLKTVFQEENIQSGLDIEMEVFTQKMPEIVDRSKHRLDETDQLRVGEWLTFLVKHKPEPLKLVWIGETPEIYVFVNRNGVKTLELGREELAELLENGAANRIESLDQPVMDRAINSMLQKMHEKLLDKATHDPVTHLLNRKEFIKQLKQELIKLLDVQHLLCHIEVQDFRVITNACGLAGGDALLKQLADLLKNELKEEELFARLDDRTFSILLKDCSAETADDVAKNLQIKLIEEPFMWEDKSYAVAVSIGMVPLFPEIDYDINTVLQNADSATLSATNTGRNRIQIYKEDDKSLQSQFNQNEWIGRLNQVFAENRLFLRCQKIAAIDPETESHTHYEILLGIKDEDGNTIAPDDFIPAVERCQRMSEVDQWVVLSVFEWIEEHDFEFDLLDGFSINLSGESLNSEEFLEFLKLTLTASNIPLEKITFEITETVAANSFLFIQRFIREIKQFNCKFSLDDFGSGYSSYSYLKSLDVDYLKIDGAFVKDITNNSTDIAIVKSMNEIGHSLGLKTIAEYVETEEIQEVLKEIGVDYAQGWGVGKPFLLKDLM